MGRASGSGNILDDNQPYDIPWSRFELVGSEEPSGRKEGITLDDIYFDLRHADDDSVTDGYKKTSKRLGN